MQSIVYKWFFCLTMMATLVACQSVNPLTPTSETNSSIVSKNLNSNNYSAIVQKVSDGDTLNVLDETGQKHRIRLAFIDAPELKQDFGKASQKFLQNQLLNQKVEIVVRDIDRYQREVATVYLYGKDMNLIQLKQGNAWHYQEYAKSKKGQNPSDFRLYEHAEHQARNQGLGLWENPNALAPWVFRKNQRKQSH